MLTVFLMVIDWVFLRHLEVVTEVKMEHVIVMDWSMVVTKVQKKEMVDCSGSTEMKDQH